MLVETILRDERWGEVGLDGLASRAAKAALLRVGLEPDAFEIGLLGCNDDQIAQLNTEFREKPMATNVLSWPSEERCAEVAGQVPELPSGDPELGDIAISYETCVREAEAADKPISEHVTHLLVHGVLHLLGYDHIRDEDAMIMEGLEVDILAPLGIADPYRMD